MRVNQDNETVAAIEALEGKIDALAAEVAGIRRHFFWEKVWGVAKLALIALPIVLGGLYAIPALTDLYDQAQRVIRQADAALPR
jgi:hypothetical protein